MESQPPAAPDLRIVQANERTLLAWVRTGLAVMAFGFVVARIDTWLRVLQPDAAPRPGSVLLGAPLLLLGALIQVAGAVRFVRAHRAIVRDEPHVPGTLAGVLLASALAAGGVGLVVYLAVR